jgi:hypothetical protein
MRHLIKEEAAILHPAMFLLSLPLQEAPVKKRLLTSTGLALALAFGAGMLSPAAAQRRDDRGRGQNVAPPRFTSDAQQLGYEHGYRDGADRGRQDRDRGLQRSVRDNDYNDSARYSYQPSFGNRRDYMSGYRDGFQAGYDDGYSYYDRPGRYGQIYGRDSSNGDRGSSRGNVQRTPFDSGYREGVAAGQQDLQRNTRSNYRQNDAYRRGDRNFQDGFERGYQDGYGRSRFEQDGGGYFPNRAANGPADTRDGVGPASRTITVPANQQWTPTGIRVNQGDRLTINATGQISLRPNDPKDVAIPPGSLLHRTAPNSPIPNALAGALIGRIDSGQPFGIGDQKSIAAPASGLLYLGVNDDVLNDNSGQFTVTIGW